MISCIDIIDDTRKDKKQMPAFVSLIERGGRGYRQIGEVLDSVELQAIGLRQMEADVLALEKRAQQFEEICDALRAAREAIVERRTKQERKRTKRTDDSLRA